MTSTIYLLVAILVSLQLLDYITTRIVLSRGGVELNPVMVKIFKVFGVQLGLIIMKGGFSALVISFAYYGLFSHYIGLFGLCVMIVMYTAVVVNNIIEVRK